MHEPQEDKIIAFGSCHPSFWVFPQDSSMFWMPRTTNFSIFLMWHPVEESLGNCLQRGNLRRDHKVGISARQFLLQGIFIGIILRLRFLRGRSLDYNFDTSGSPRINRETQ